MNRSAPRARAASRQASKACWLAWTSANRASSTHSPPPSDNPRAAARALRDIKQDATAESCFPTCDRIARLLLILGRHSWGKQGRKGQPVPRLGSGLEFAGRWIAAGCLDDGPRENVFPRGIDQPALAGSEIRGAAALGMTGRDLILRRVGLFRQRIAIGKPIGPRRAARPIVFIECLHPKIDRA